MLQSKMNEAASRSLGSANSYAISTSQFDPSQLNPMPRSEARREWGITGKEFKGYDVWHCHEATFLLDNGLPVAGTLKVICKASSEFMVESKSFKLYLNTFDMCKMGPTIQSAIENYEKQITADISNCIKDTVSVMFFNSGDDVRFEGNPVGGYLDIAHIVTKQKLEALEISDYTAKNSYNIMMADCKETELSTSKYFTNVLRSRCRHTKQKDTGTAYFSITTKTGVVDPIELLKLVISLREVNEFHEFCAEKLYIEIMKVPEVLKCTVTLMYARRGSLDICPTRSTDENDMPIELISKDYYTKKTMGQ